jgi:hypothetical protein
VNCEREKYFIAGMGAQALGEGAAGLVCILGLRFSPVDVEVFAGEDELSSRKEGA